MKTLVLALFFISAGSAARQPFTPGDLWIWRTAGDPQISPDGSQVVYPESWSDRARDAVYDNLWLGASDGSRRVPLTEGDWRDRSPRWSADGAAIAYISTRKGLTQIWVRSAKAAGERSLTAGGMAPLALAWSPDGRSIAFTARESAPRPPAWAPLEVLPYLWPRPRGKVQVYIVPSAGGEAVRISSDELDFQGEPAWMPDGRSILCAAGGQIFSIRLADRAVRELTREDSLNSVPVPSPDGGKIAFLALDPHPQSNAMHKLFVMSPDGGRLRALAGSLGRDVRHPQWSNDSRTVYCIADDRGATHVYAARNDGSVRQVTAREETLRGFTLAGNGRAAAVRFTAGEGGAVVTFAVDLPAGVATVASPNEHLLADRNLGAGEAVEFPSAGRRLQAWLVKPPAFDAARQYPLLLLAEDAPRRMCGPEFDLRAQVFAAAGYLVLCVNPRGTPGYGEEFGNLLPTAFPDDPAADLLRAVDFLAARPFVDAKRSAVIGGPVAAWLLGHSTRFAAAVLQGAFTGPAPWEDPDRYPKRLPISFAAAIQARTLIVAGQEITRSEELYAALARRKVPASVLRLATGQPSQRVLEVEAELAWLK